MLGHRQRRSSYEGVLFDKKIRTLKPFDNLQVRIHARNSVLFYCVRERNKPTRGVPDHCIIAPNFLVCIAS